MHHGLKNFVNKDFISIPSWSVKLTDQHGIAPGGALLPIREGLDMELQLCGARSSSPGPAVRSGPLGGLGENSVRLARTIRYMRMRPFPPSSPLIIIVLVAGP